ncbi:MAG: 2-dehydropantoate 2-reductase [Chloroflexi bacterium]|nr:MAG: 2-dehydropantoate 2-reductase [Chloroflexota bacterium]
MRIVFFGAGGVGGYFGGRLAQAGRDVTFIARGRHLEAMRTRGLRVDSINGDFVVHPVQAVDDPARLGPVDAVFVAVKAWQVPEAARLIRPLVGPETVVVPLQNGVEAPSMLADVLGQAYVLGGFCRIVSYIVEPGHLRHAGGNPPYIAFGELDNTRSERVLRLLSIFEGVQGVVAEVPPDIQAAMWGKLMQISAWSGMGAITRAPAGVWRSLPETRQMWLNAVYEVLAVAQARGIALTEEVAQKVIAYVDKLPPDATASMQRDILDGRPSELEYQNGAVVRLGREVGVDAPTHAFIYYSLLPQEMKARGQIDF